ncbi:unnamed protein product [Prorocentrum cordatum]|uniref:Uncharacterized protein n=1 Tax=Prorocentrum cordatum TaxID=2364126 RepID=A0ABN9PX30_9DINO|nr:unnamed protein product [Polarella glacialis]
MISHGITSPLLSAFRSPLAHLSTVSLASSPFKSVLIQFQAFFSFAHSTISVFTFMQCQGMTTVAYCAIDRFRDLPPNSTVSAWWIHVVIMFTAVMLVRSLIPTIATAVHAGYWGHLGGE